MNTVTGASAAPLYTNGLNEHLESIYDNASRVQSVAHRIRSLATAIDAEIETLNGERPNKVCLGATGRIDDLNTLIDEQASSIGVTGEAIGTAALRGRVAHTPSPSNDAWNAALKVYLDAKAAEDAYDRDYYASAKAPALVEIEAEFVQLQTLRFSSEDTLMAIPSPDPIAFIRKCLIAQQSDNWNGMIESEAKRFIGECGE